MEFQDDDVVTYEESSFGQSGWTNFSSLENPVNRKAIKSAFPIRRKRNVDSAVSRTDLRSQKSFDFSFGEDGDLEACGSIDHPPCDNAENMKEQACDSNFDLMRYESPRSQLVKELNLTQTSKHDEELAVRTCDGSSSGQARLTDSFVDASSGDDKAKLAAMPSQDDSICANIQDSRSGLSTQVGLSRQKDVLGDRPSHWGTGASKLLSSKSKNSKSNRNSSSSMTGKTRTMSSHRASVPCQSSAVLWASAKSGKSLQGRVVAETVKFQPSWLQSFVPDSSTAYKRDSSRTLGPRDEVADFDEPETSTSSRNQLELTQNATGAGAPSNLSGRLNCREIEHSPNFELTGRDQRQHQHQREQSQYAGSFSHYSANATVSTSFSNSSSFSNFASPGHTSGSGSGQHGGHGHGSTRRGGAGKARPGSLKARLFKISRAVDGDETRLLSTGPGAGGAARAGRARPRDPLDPRNRADLILDAEVVHDRGRVGSFRAVVLRVVQVTSKTSRALKDSPSGPEVGSPRGPGLNSPRGIGLDSPWRLTADKPRGNGFTSIGGGGGGEEEEEEDQEDGGERDERYGGMRGTEEGAALADDDERCPYTSRGDLHTTTATATGTATAATSSNKAARGSLSEGTYLLAFFKLASLGGGRNLRAETVIRLYDPAPIPIASSSSSSSSSSSRRGIAKQGAQTRATTAAGAEGGARTRAETGIGAAKAGGGDGDGAGGGAGDGDGDGDAEPTASMDVTRSASGSEDLCGRDHAMAGVGMSAALLCIPPRVLQQLCSLQDIPSRWSGANHSDEVGRFDESGPGSGSGPGSRSGTGSGGAVLEAELLSPPPPGSAGPAASRNASGHKDSVPAALPTMVWGILLCTQLWEQLDSIG